MRARLEQYRELEVLTISLNDVFETCFDGQPIEYMSVDTEGSELQILSTFAFDRYHPSVVTIEHNHTVAEPKLDQLLANSQPPVLVVPDVRGLQAVPDIASRINKQLGLLE